MSEFVKTILQPGDNIIFVLTRNVIAAVIIGTMCYLYLSGASVPESLMNICMVVVGTFINAPHREP